MKKSFLIFKFLGVFFLIPISLYAQSRIPCEKVENRSGALICIQTDRGGASIETVINRHKKPDRYLIPARCNKIEVLEKHFTCHFTSKGDGSTHTAQYDKTTGLPIARGFFQNLTGNYSSYEWLNICELGGGATQKRQIEINYRGQKLSFLVWKVGSSNKNCYIQFKSPTQQALLAPVNGTTPYTSCIFKPDGIQCQSYKTVSHPEHSAIKAREPEGEPDRILFRNLLVPANRRIERTYTDDSAPNSAPTENSSGSAD